MGDSTERARWMGAALVSAAATAGSSAVSGASSGSALPASKDAVPLPVSKLPVPLLSKPAPLSRVAPLSKPVAGVGRAGGDVVRGDAQLRVVDRGEVLLGRRHEGDRQAGGALVAEDGLERPGEAFLGRVEQQARVGLGPGLGDGGDVELERLAAVDEGPLHGRRSRAVLAGVLRGGVARRLAVGVAEPLGSGEAGDDVGGVLGRGAAALLGAEREHHRRLGHLRAGREVHQVPQERGELVGRTVLAATTATARSSSATLSCSWSGPAP
jgi:hypothetical protein